MHATAREWQPRIGEVVQYISNYSSFTRGCPVRVMAEARGARMRVLLMKRDQTPVMVTVKTCNLFPLPASLFDLE